MVRVRKEREKYFTVTSGRMSVRCGQRSCNPEHGKKPATLKWGRAAGRGDSKSKDPGKGIELAFFKEGKGGRVNMFVICSLPCSEPIS